MQLHHCDVRLDEGEFVTRPGWRVHCLVGCRTWYYTDTGGEPGMIRAFAAALHHEEMGSWPPNLPTPAKSVD